MNTQKREQKETTHPYQTNTVSLCRSMDVSRDEGTGFEATEGVAGVLRGRSEARAAHGRLPSNEPPGGGEDEDGQDSGGEEVGKAEEKVEAEEAGEEEAEEEEEKEPSVDE